VKHTTTNQPNGTNAMNTTTTTTEKLNLNLMSVRVDSRSSKTDIVAQIVRLVRVLDAGELARNLDAGQLGTVSLLRSFTHGKFAGQDVRGYLSDFEREARDAFHAIAGARSTNKATWRTIFDAIKATAKVVATERREARAAERKAARSPEKVAADARHTAKVAGDRSSSATAKVAELRAELAQAIEAEATAMKRHADKVELADAAELEATDAPATAAELAEVAAILNPDGMPETNIDLPSSADADQPELTELERSSTATTTEHKAARPDPSSAAAPTWLVALKAANAEAEAVGEALPFGGNPIAQGGTWKAGTYHELYAGGGTLRAFLADDGTEMARLTFPTLACDLTVGEANARESETTRHADEAKADAANACGTCGGELCTHSGYTHDGDDLDAEGFARRACAPCGLRGFSRASLSRGPCFCAGRVDPAPHANRLATVVADDLVTVLDPATDTTRASVCCGFAIRRFNNGAEVCESCGRRCDHEPAPAGGAPSIDGLAPSSAAGVVEVGTFPATHDGIKAAASAAVKAIAASKLAEANAATGAGRREAAGARVVWRNLVSRDPRKAAAVAILRAAAGMAPGVGKVTRVELEKQGDTVRGDVLRKRKGERTWENLGTFLADLPERHALTD